MNERERVYDLISEYAIQYREWMNKGVKLPRLDREEVVDQIDALYDALYSDRDKKMREALELIWAYSLDPELEWKEAMENIERTVRQALKEGDK